MKKSILALVLAAVLITALVFVAAPKAEAAGNHNCSGNHCACAGKATKHCDNKKVKWTAVRTADEFTAAFGNGAHVYLTADITIDTDIKCYNVKSICLNGYTLTCTSKNGVIVGTTSASEADRVLTITDCQYNGTKGGTLDSRISMRCNSVLNVYGGFLTNTNTTAVEVINQSGTYTPSVVNLYNGHIKGGEGVRAVNQGADCTFNMYGGTISGGSGSTEDGKYYGGNIIAVGTFNISGGKITGGKADVGGNIHVKAGGTLNISGSAVIENGTANNSGNVYAEGDVYMKGGTVKNGVSLTNYGGNIQMAGKKDALAILKISGGTVSGGTTVEYNGGNIALQNADCTISGGTISGGEVTTGNSATKGGGNIALVSGKLTITGGKITGGKAHYGGNILIRQNDNTKQANSELIITGGTITGGVATANGGNIYIYSDSSNAAKAPSKLEISGGIISNGSAGTADVTGNGGNIYISGSVHALKDGINITGGTFIGGTATRYGGSICFNGKVGCDIVFKKATFSGGKVINKFGGNLYFNADNVSVLIEKCTVSGGVAIEAGGNIYNNGAVEFVIKDCAINNGNAKIGGGVSVKPGFLVKLQGEVTTSGNVNGGLGVRDVGAEAYSMFSVSGLTGGKVSIFAEQAGLVCEETSDYVEAPKDTQELKVEGGKLYLQGKDGNVVSVDGTGYATMDAAVITDGAKIQLLIGTAGQTLNLTENAVVDFNGCKIDGVTVAAGKTLYGYDNTTNGYEEAGAAKVAITGEGTVAAAYTTTEPIRKYMTIKNEDGTYSFHRYYVGITKKTLHIGTKGIGVTAAFAGTPSVKALMKDTKSFGVELNSAEDFTGTANNVVSETAFSSGKANTLKAIIDNYLLTKDAAEAKLYARAFIELADGTKLYSAVATVDAKEVMLAIDVSAAAMDKDKKKAVQLMINGLSWNLPEAWSLTNFEKK